MARTHVLEHRENNEYDNDFFKKMGKKINSLMCDKHV